MGAWGRAGPWHAAPLWTRGGSEGRAPGGAVTETTAEFTSVTRHRARQKRLSRGESVGMSRASKSGGPWTRPGKRMTAGEQGCDEGTQDARGAPGHRTWPESLSWWGGNGQANRERGERASPPVRATLLPRQPRHVEPCHWRGQGRSGGKDTVNLSPSSPQLSWNV